MRKKKKKYHTQENLKKACINNQKDVFIPEKSKFLNLKTESWFKIRKTRNNFISNNSKIEPAIESYFTRKYIFKPTE